MNRYNYLNGSYAGIDENASSMVAHLDDGPVRTGLRHRNNALAQYFEPSESGR